MINLSAEIGVEREASAKAFDLRAHSCLNRSVSFVGVRSLEAVEHFRDQLADLGELGRSETARGAGRRSKTHARRDERLLWIERDPVLVASDVRTTKSRLGALAGGILRAQINQHQV